MKIWQMAVYKAICRAVYVYLLTWKFDGSPPCDFQDDVCQSTTPHCGRYFYRFLKQGQPEVFAGSLMNNERALCSYRMRIVSFLGGSSSDAQEKVYFKSGVAIVAQGRSLAGGEVQSIFLVRPHQRRRGRHVSGLEIRDPLKTVSGLYYLVTFLLWCWRGIVSPFNTRFS